MKDKIKISEIMTKVRENNSSRQQEQGMLGTRFDGAREAACRNEFLEQAQKLGFSDKERKALERLYGKDSLLGG